MPKISTKTAGAYEIGVSTIVRTGHSSELITDIHQWQIRYENAHFQKFSDLQEIVNLDDQGLLICKRIKQECPEAKIEYFSAGEMKKIPNA